MWSAQASTSAAVTLGAAGSKQLWDEAPGRAAPTTFVSLDVAGPALKGTSPPQLMVVVVVVVVVVVLLLCDRRFFRSVCVSAK
jgi:hypothetical protein